MARGNPALTDRHLGALFGGGMVGALSDGQLLERFASRRGEVAELAFRALVERHGPMVRRVCLGMLRDANDADDAFQATFLILVRRAGSLWVRDSLAPWLYQVACRTSAHARSAASRRRRHERIAAGSKGLPPERLDLDDLGRIVHEEVGRLPGPYREAVVLCLLEGLTPEAAAGTLNCPVGTVHSRLARGREKLRGRLERRGLAYPSLPFLAGVGRSSAVPQTLADATTRAASRLVAAGEVPASAASLLGVATRAYLMDRFKLAAATSLLLGSLAFSAVVLGRSGAEGQEPAPPRSEARGADVGPALEVPRARAGAPATDAMGDLLPPHARLRLGTLRFRPPSTVTDLALSPDEATVVSVGAEIIAWDAATGKETWRALASDHGIEIPAAAYGQRSLAFSADNARFYTPGQGDDVIAWGTSTGRPEVLHPAGTIDRPRPNLVGRATARSIDVAPDGKTLALGRAGGVVVFEPGGQVLHEIANRPAAPLQFSGDDRLTFAGDYSLARFSPDGATLAVVTSDRPEEVRLCEARTGRERATIRLGSRLVRLAFSPDGKRLAATERDSAVRLYEVETGRRLWSHVVQLANIYENYTSAIAFGPDGKVLAVAATDNRIHLIDPADGAEVGKLSGHDWYPWALAFGARGAMLYSSGWDPAIRRWDIAGRKQIPLPSGVHATAVVAASPAGRTLAYADASETIRLVDSERGTERRTLALPGSGYSQLAFSKDGRLLAGGGTSGDNVHVAVWEVATGALRHRWDWPKGRDPHSTVESLAFSADGTRLAAAVFRQSSAYFWDLTLGREVAKLKHSQVYGLAFGPDGRTLATAGWDKIIRIWDAEAGAVRREVAVADHLKGGDLRMYAVAWSSDGGVVASAHMDGTVLVWQADEMLLRRRIDVPGGFVFGALNFSDDGLWLATGSRSGDVEVWDPATGARVWDGGRHQGNVYTVGFDGDARSVVSGGGDGLCYLWDLRPTGDRPAEDAAQALRDLASDDGPAAYRATWALAGMPDRAVPLLADMLRPVKSLIDLDRIAAEGPPDEDRRGRRLRKILIEKQPEVESTTAARRAVAILGRIATPGALNLLKELADRDPASELGRIAAAGFYRGELSAGP